MGCSTVSTVNTAIDTDHSLICTYQTSISTHITYELLQGVEYTEAVRKSFSLFESDSTEGSLDRLHETLDAHFDSEQRRLFATTLGLAGIVWATGFSDGWVTGTYEEMRERAFLVCLEGSMQTGIVSYFDAYYMSLMYLLDDRSGKPKAQVISH